jgi:hypothetical protein
MCATPCGGRSYKENRYKWTTNVEVHELIKINDI